MPPSDSSPPTSENPNDKPEDGPVNEREAESDRHGVTKILNADPSRTTSLCEDAKESSAPPDAASELHHFSPSEDTFSAIRDLGLTLQPAPEVHIIGRVAHYDIIKCLGRGGMGTVFEAFDTKLFRPVAIKFMASSLAANEKSRARFLREARVAASINHANVVTIHSVDEYDGRPYLVMELVAGTNLHQHLKSTGPMPISDVLRIGRQIATGLRAAHKNGIVHRDVKPGNILLENGIHRVKLVDFGLAQVIFETSDITSVGQTLGTPRYMAPEQIEGNRVDERADLFSFGCVLYAMCTGYPPFSGNSISVLHRILREPHVPLGQALPNAPRELAQLVDSMLCKDREQRIQTAVEAESILTELIREGTSSDSIAGTGRSPRVPPSSTGSRRLRLTAVVTAALAVLLTIAWLMFPPQQEGGNDATVSSASAPDARPVASPVVSTDGPETVPSVPDRNPVTSTVGGADADFSSLKEALLKTVAGDTLVVTGPLPVDDTLLLSDPARHTNLTIDWQTDTDLRLTEAVPAGITIDNVSGISIRGARVKAENRHLLSVRGTCPDLTLEKCLLEQAPGSLQAAVVFWSGTQGMPSRPIVIRDCELVFFDLGCAFIGAADSPVQWVRLENNCIRCLQPAWGTAMVMENAVRHMEVRGNRIASVRAGLNLVGAADNVRVTGNSFFNIISCVGAVSLSQTQAVDIMANLAVDCEDFSTGTWPTDTSVTFADNVSNLPMLNQPFVKTGNDLKFLSLDFTDSDFLRPFVHPDLIPESSNSSLHFIGALQPAASP